jgi:cephalosporin-C deacetylase-like acetyl esterase
MVLNYLAGRGDLDMNRVGMVASGSGASIAILASAVDPRIKVLDAMNPWGDWPVWMATSPFVPQEERAQYVKPEYLEKVAALDPVDWLPKVRAKNFRLQGSAFDTRTPAAALQKLRTAVPASATVTIYKTTDDLYPIVRDHTELQWIKQELKTLSNANGVSLAVTTGK